MRKSNVFLSITLFLCLNQILVNGQTIQPVERSVGKLQISIDQRMEVLATVQLLANYPVVNRDLPYSKEILTFFEPFASQEAVTLTNSLLQNHGFSYDAPVTFMLYLSQLPELNTQIEFTDYLKGRSGGGNNLEQYRKSIKQFAETSNFESFWNSKAPFYNQILDATIADMGEMDMVKAMEDYFNETQESYNIIIVPAFRGGYGPRIPGNNGKYNIYACISANNMKDNIPFLSLNTLRYYVWHEFGHSFVNPLAEKYADRVASSSKMLEPIMSWMAMQAYGNWETVVNEHIIRAIHVRLEELHLGLEQSQRLLADQIKNRYIYIEPLIGKLKVFENKRDRDNITFSEFYPELLNVLDSLQKNEYWKQIEMSFTGPLNGVVLEAKTAWIYPTQDSDTEALKIVQDYTSQVFERFAKPRGGILLADTVALKTDLSEYGIVAYGTIESNLFLKQYAPTYPFRVENQVIHANREYADKDIKFISCVPNPHNPNKGMSIYTALSNKNIQGINDVFHGGEDYILFLNRETILDRGFYKKNEKWTF